MKFHSVLGVLIILGVSSITFAQTSGSPRPFTIDDLFGMQEVSDAQISPDGQFVAYTVNTTSLKEDKTATRVWMVPTAGADPYRAHRRGLSSSHARWSPDGKFIAFLSEREEEKTQVYLLNRLGGEAQRLTDTAQDVDTFLWSPDGKRILLVLRDPSPEELEAAPTRAKITRRIRAQPRRNPKRSGPGSSTACCLKRTPLAIWIAAAPIFIVSSKSLKSAVLVEITTIASRRGRPMESRSLLPAIAPSRSRF